jgi:iron(III) transport system substrate-binding protein
LGVAALAVLAACGSGGGSSGSATTPPASPASGTGTAAVTSQGASAGSTSTSSPATAEEDAWHAQTAAAAEKEGAVTLYAVATAANIDNLSKAWAAAYPNIKLTVVNTNTTEMESRIGAESQTGSIQGDILTLGDQAWIPAHTSLFQMPTTPLQKTSDWTPYVGQGGLTTTTKYAPLGIAWAGSKVSAPIKDYPDLLRPDLKGQIGLVDALTPTYTAIYRAMEAKFGEQFMRDLAAQNPHFYPSGPTLLQGTVAGEVNVGADMSLSADSVVQNGGPLSSVFPASYTPVAAGSLMIFKGAKHPNAAQLLYDYFLTRPGQQAWNYLDMSPLPGIPGTSGGPAEIKAATLVDTSDKAGLDQYLVHWKSIFHR